MKVLVVGGGGARARHLLKLAQSPKVTELYCAPGNGGIAQVATCVPIKATDVEAMVRWARENAMDFVMVAPDDPLAWGWWTPWRQRHPRFRPPGQPPPSSRPARPSPRN